MFWTKTCRQRLRRWPNPRLGESWDVAMGHSYSSRASRFQNAVRSKFFNEAIDRLLRSRSLQHQRIWRCFQHAGIQSLNCVQYIRSLARWHSELDNRELTMDRWHLRDVFHVQHLGKLIQICLHQRRSELINPYYDGHARYIGNMCWADT